VDIHNLVARRKVGDVLRLEEGLELAVLGDEVEGGGEVAVGRLVVGWVGRIAVIFDFLFHGAALFGVQRYIGRGLWDV
jgi:hypothetical protein